MKLTRRHISLISKKFEIDAQHADNINVVYPKIYNYAALEINEDQKRDAISGWINQQCLPSTDFDWINIKNQRMCDFVWSLLRMMKNEVLPIILDSQNMPSILKAPQEFIFHTAQSHPLPSEHIYTILNIEPLPKDSQTKKDTIIEFFDLWSVTKEAKAIALDKIKYKWMLVSKKNDVSNWVVDDDKKTWAWHYLHQENTPIWFINNDNRNDYSDGVITTFDLLCDHPDKRALTLSKMKSAWSQKAYRDRNNGKKSVSIVLPEDVIKNLDYICQKTDRRKNEVVARLIRNEYDKIHKGKD